MFPKAPGAGKLFRRLFIRVWKFVPKPLGVRDNLPNTYSNRVWKILPKRFGVRENLSEASGGSG